MEVIKLKNVYKSFLAESHPSIMSLLTNRVQRTTILKDISFDVHAGEFLGVIGHNGAGKSTLLRLVGGVYQKDSGDIITRGELVSIFEVGSFANSEVTGRRYCVDYFNFRGISGKRLKELVELVLDFTELGEFFDQPIKHYSSGMQAKLLFGAATAIPAPIVLIDEFLVVGDEYFRGKAWERLRQFISGGTTGIIVSHDWVSLLKLCKRGMIMTQGGIEFQGKTYEVVQKYLDIPYLESDELHFLDKDRMISTPVYATSGEDFCYTFSVEVLGKFTENDFMVCFSIERYQEGQGWSLALTGLSVIEVKDKKIIDISINIPAFILASGEYLLCLFLNSSLKPGQVSIEKGYESLTWLNGRPIKLVVEGDNPSGQLFERKLQWKIKQV